ncbi:MAG TPA: HAMP domain-containing sensor histidine kinase [Anaeromyxobacteraceae bacterium]|nr:HAMP domain-containing sensor histidine kinase [Anaeromyxobacteraceae bacterium]
MASAPPPGFDEIQRQEVNRLFGRIVGVRLLFLPLLMALAVWLAFTDTSPWRRLLVSCVAAAVVALVALEAARARGLGIERLSIPLNVIGAALGSSIIILGTGGLGSPFAFLMPVLALVAGILLDVSALLAAVGVQLAAVALGAAGAGPLALRALGEPGTALRTWSAAGVLAFLVAGGAGLGRATRRVFDEMVRRALAAQEDALRSHRERAAELAALSAEIAHELKNPLASVKGLAGLLGPAVADAKAAERLAVLRREVDRMQSILDEFLNFSRPLVPLALGRTDVGALAREVLALHEGTAHERGVELELRGEATARCDPRKVKQVLINLLQNALDASPAGSRVEVEVSEEPEGARVAVLDRGPGLDPAVAGRVFDPGVTTKPGGSGIGLTVARALARQHGGELHLVARPGGGVSAEFVLPTLPAGAEAAA